MIVINYSTLDNAGKFSCKIRIVSVPPRKEEKKIMSQRA